MLRLLKYELRKTLASKLILLGIAVIAEVVFLIGFENSHERTLTVGAILLFFTATIGIGLVGILSLVTLHRDMNTRQGYMLFMTPNSCYKILGAKVIECALSLLIAGAFFFGLGVLDFSILLGKDANRQIWDILRQVLEGISSRIVLNVPTFSAFVFWMLSAWLCTITTAYLSDVVSSSLLNGKKYNWILTFVLFLALNYVISRITLLVPSSLEVIRMYIWQGVIALGLAGVMYVVTARLMDKYLSV